MNTWVAWMMLVAILMTGCGGGYRISNTEEHSDAQGTRWAVFDVVTQADQSDKSELRKIALVMKKNEAAEYDIAYLIFHGSEAAGGGAGATIVNTQRGLEKHKEIVPSWQHEDAKKAMRNGGVYVMALE
jgi:hypothetical protein